MEFKEIISNNKNLINFKELDNLKDIFVVDFAPNGKVVSKIFLDSSGNVLSSGDLIEEYQEKILKNEYFSSKNSLPWNMYLYFIIDEDVKSKNSALIDKIEQNETYSRKKFLTPQSLQNSYPFGRSEAISNLVNSNQLVDPSIKWIETLNNLNMSFVQDSSAPLGSSVESYIDGTFKATLVDTSKSSSNQSYKLDIAPKKLNINSYRKFPLTGTYELGKVNVFYGPNAVGKTSFLEAIELILTGETLRNGVEAGTIDISITDSAGNIEKYAPNDKDKFRYRDQYWYQNYYERGNYLNASFNRFNCYNTDAAFELATDDTRKNLNEAIEALALGAKTKVILDRMEKFEDRFKTAFNMLNKEKGRLEDESRQLLSQKDTLEKNSKIISFDFSSKINDLKNNALIDLLDKSYQESEIAKLKDVLSKIDLSLEAMLPILKKRLMVYKPNEWIAKLQLCNNLNTQILSFTASREEAKPKLITAKHAKDLAEAKKARVKRLNDYLNFPNTNLFQNGLSNELAGLTNKIKTIELAKTILQQADFQPGDIDKMIFEDAEAWADSEISKQIAISDDLKNKISISNSASEKRRQQILDIKSLAKDLIQHDPGSQSCPACQHQFNSHAELMNFISQVSFQITQNDKLISDKNEADEKIKQLISAKSKLDRISKTIKTLKIGNERDFVSELLTKFSAEFAQTQSLEVRASDLAKIKDGLKQAGFIESEFNELLKELLPNVEANEFQMLKDEAVKLEKSLNDSINSIEQNISLVSQPLVIEFAKIKQAIEMLLGSQEEAKIYENFFAFHNDLKVLCKSDEELKLLVLIIENFDLHMASQYIKNTIKEISQHIIFIDENIRNSTILNETGNKLVQVNNELNKVMPKFERAKIAFENLTMMLAQYKETNPIQNFFTYNMKLVAEIFRRIHSPFEFIDVKFEKDNFMLSRDGIDYIPLTKISTGQRSALALSVFFAVHLTCQSAPNILIFDDPVSFVDDLNVLSFLDFLRELVLEQDKQVFVTTANYKLASLIGKKFDFLGSDFVSKEFSRQPDSP